MLVAAVQMVANSGKPNNLPQAEILIQQAVDQGAELVVLPEYFAYYGSNTDLERQVQAEASESGPARQFLSEQAKKHNIWLVGGTVPILDSSDGESDKRPFSTSLLVNPSGKVAARYNKIHLFDANVDQGGGAEQKAYRESDSYRPGSDVITADMPLGRLGMSVCYDIRFPELYRELSSRGAEILIVPAAFTSVTGKAHWQLLLRARAVENLCYVVGANMGDREHPEKPTWGGSAIVDPWGEVLASCDVGPGVAIADIDRDRLQTLRRQLTALEHRRL